MTSAVHDYTYSVQVKSRFDLLGNDDYNTEDPAHLIRKMRTQTQEAKATAVATPAPKPVVEKRNEKPAEVSSRDQPREARGKGNRGRGGFSRSRQIPTGGQRQFDRHSGSDKTGVKAVMKKDGHGTGNWGTMEDELEAQITETIVETPVEEEVSAEQPAVESAEPVEEELKTLTLKEYREQLKASKAKVQLSTKGTRRANDGKNVFNNMVEVHKSKPTETKVAVVLEEENNTSVKETKPVFFDFGHGGGRPQGGRDGPHGPRPSGPAGEFRGRGGGPRFQQREQPEMSTEGERESPANTERPTSRGGRGGERGRGGRGALRGGGAPRGSFNFERGIGAPRGSFNSERGTGAPRGSFNSERGTGAPRGSFNPERGGRGGAAGDRPSFRGGERGGGRFMRGAGGPRGGFRGGRGGAPHQDEGRPTGSFRTSAPVMDSVDDFPALK